MDDVLATGGTADCVNKILKENGKEVMGLAVVLEIANLNARKHLKFPIISQVEY